MSEALLPGKFSGAECDLAASIENHLFIISPNQSGSTFLSKTIAQCRAVWSMPREGQHMLGYVGPDTLSLGIPLSWASSQSHIDLVKAPENYDWEKTKKAWYFQAQAARSDATILLTKSPPFLLITEQLLKHFKGAMFIFLVRNPYAIVEGICRRTGTLAKQRMAALKEASQHVIACFEHQNDNIETYRATSIFLTYEDICKDPKRAANRISQLLPELNDLNLDQRIAVKGMYNEALRNMNDDHIARLGRKDISTINRIFMPKLDLFQRFGYELLPDQ